MNAKKKSALGDLSRVMIQPFGFRSFAAAVAIIKAISMMVIMPMIRFVKMTDL